MKQQNRLAMHLRKRNWSSLVFWPFLTVIFLLLNMTSAPAAGAAGQTLGQVATQITGSFSELAKLITASSYVAGMGFALSSILKFKQHKDNPQQIPIGTPIALLFIAAGLIFLPTIFHVAGQTVFGTSATSGGVSGVSS